MRALAMALAAVALLSGAPGVRADNFFHKAPFDFLFGNHFDTHQETRLDRNSTDGCTGRTAGEVLHHLYRSR